MSESTVDEETAGTSPDDDKIRDAMRHVSLPKVPDWDVAETLGYDVKRDKSTGEMENIVDYEHLDGANDTINSIRVALFRVTRGLDDVERKLKVAKTKYDRKFRREYLASAEKTEMRKKAEAALLTEHLEDDILYLEQIKSELTRRAGLLKDELSSMMTLSNNIRAQVKQST